MANTRYPKGNERFATGTLSWTSDDIRVMLVRDTYTYNPAHQFVSDVVASDNGRSAALVNKTATNGEVDADDTTITATAAVACNALILFRHTGNNATADLIAYLDTPATGLPFTPAASQVVPIVWSSGADKIFTL